MQTYLDYIGRKAARLIHNRYDSRLKERIFLPIGIDVQFTHADLDEALGRLKKLYKDGREGRVTYDSNLILRNLLQYYYFDHDALVDDYRVEGQAYSYYEASRKLTDEIPSGQQYPIQNKDYEIVIRNLLILAENLGSHNRIVVLEKIDISLNAICLLCDEQIRKLFQTDDYRTSDLELMIKNSRDRGGLPLQYFKYIDDPKEKGKIKNLLYGTPRIRSEVMIRLYDCNYAHLFYAVLLTALVFNLEVKD